MTKHKVLKQAGLPDALTAELAERYQLYDSRCLTPVQTQMLAESCEVVITNGEAVVSRKFIASMPALKLIVVFGVGYDGVDIAAAREYGVTVTHTPGVLTDDVADLAMGLILATARRIVAAHQFIERGGWRDGGFTWTRKVSGARLGIVGMGRIGQTLARRASGFDMDIAYYNRSPVAGCDGRRVESLTALAARSDFLAVCLPGGEETWALIDQEVLTALGPEGILVNIGRGSVVDEAALIAALDTGAIAGAGLDVFACEPDVPAALQGRDNVVITPHMASATHHTRARMSQLVLDNVAAWFATGRPVTPVA